MEKATGTPAPVALYRTQARRLGDTLVHVVQRDSCLRAAFWNRRHSFNSGLPSLDINQGSAGILLALSALVSTFDEFAHQPRSPKQPGGS